MLAIIFEPAIRNSIMVEPFFFAVTLPVSSTSATVGFLEVKLSS